MKHKNYIIYSVIIIFLDIPLAILPHILVKPFWNMDSDYLAHATLSEALYTLLLLPIILIRLNKWIGKKIVVNRINYLVVSLIVVIISILMSNYFHYKNFGDMTGRGGDPDIGTRIMSIVVPAIGILIVLIDIGIKLLKNYRK